MKNRRSRPVRDAIDFALARLALINVARKRGDGLHPVSAVVVGAQLFFVFVMPIFIVAPHFNLHLAPVGWGKIGPSVVVCFVMQGFMVFGYFIGEFYRPDIKSAIANLESTPSDEIRRIRRVIAAIFAIPPAVLVLGALCINGTLGYIVDHWSSR